jgi:hypothetical protein
VTYPPNYLSFLVRLWCEESPESAEPVAGWQGEIEHIQSGQRWTFNSLDEMLMFLRRQMEDEAVLGWPPCN